MAEPALDGDTRRENSLAVRARRLRLTELELLLVPSLLTVSGLLLIVLLERRALEWHWRDVSVSLAFIAALLVVHIYLTVRRRDVDQVLFPVVAMLTAVGMVLIQRLARLSSSVPALEGIDIRQTIWIFLGIGTLLATLTAFRWVNTLRRYKYTFALLGIAMMLALLLPGLGMEVNGARLWYNLGFFQFQPTELVKVILVFFFAAYLDERRDLLASEYRVGPLRLPPLPYLAPMVAMWAASMLTLVVLRDLGSALLFFGVFVAMLYALTGRALYVWVLGAGFLAGSYLAYQTFTHVQTRVETWLYPFHDPYGFGYYQIVQSLFALASGGVYGSGLGYGRPQTIPAVHTDMVFSAIGEELGLIGTLAVLCLYLLLAYRGFYIALRAQNGFYQLLAVGLTTIFGLQSLIIIAGAVKLTPLTGITLPFISYGGSSLVSNFLMVGILLGISGATRRGDAS
ncbi:MAG: FtsW/RodA/SpoVE family cell cycle protein [Chloroflexota bacterium]|nr:FtsW/RodA/SpoVE family cell cycle protein [Chloroflexota bacterium]